MHSLVLTGPVEHIDGVIDALLGSGHDTVPRHGAVIDYAVRRFGWIVEDPTEILDDGPLEIAA